MRGADRETWCDVGQFRACIERSGRFSVHGKPDLSTGFAQPVVLARGWIRDGEVAYEPPSPPLAPDLERDLLAASRRVSIRSVGDDHRD